MSRLCVVAAFTVTLSALLISPVRAGTFEVYHIGNSLTYQATGGDLLKNHAASRGIDVDYGWHIRCGSGLTEIAANPTDTCVPPTSYGYFGQALPNNHWDAVTFQPYGDTLPSAEGLIGLMMALTRSRPDNAATKFYIYQNFPQDLAGEDYSHAWPQPYDGSRRRTWTRDYSNLMMTQLRKQYPDPNTQPILIPSGEVLYELDQLAQAGELPGVSGVEQWYGDPFHLTAFGTFAAESTMFATMFKQDPVGLTPPPGMSAALAQKITETVWSVVQSNQFTNLNVPEPSSVALLAVAAVGVLRRKRR